MTFKGKEIGTPTIEQVEESIRLCKFNFRAIDCYVYFKEKNWLTKKGEPYKSLEFACVVYNGVNVYKKQHSKNKEVEIIKEAEEQSYSPYRDQLTSKEWILFRDFVVCARGGKCESCGTKKRLQIHHLRYENGCKAWEYNVKDVRILCQTCHRKIHNLE